MKLIYKWIFVPLLLVSLVACGGDGGGQGADNALSGTAAKGLIINGTVKVFALGAGGVKSDLLATVQTDARGRFTADIGDYAGAVLVEASGPYIDEATGLSAVIAEDAPLRAALTHAGGALSVAVTAFTELAVRRAEAAGGLGANLVQEANSLLSDLLRFDILATLPVPPAADDLAGADEAQQTCTLALAALCQLACDRGQTIPQLLAELANEIVTSGRLTHGTLDHLAQSTGAFLAGAQNQTGVTDPSTTILPRLGRTPARLRLEALGTMGADAIGGIELRLILPDGSRLATDSLGQVLDGVVSLAPGLAGTYLDVHYLPETATESAEVRLALISPGGFGPGEFATVDFEVLGSRLPETSDLSLASFTAVDGNGSPLAGVSGALVVDGR